MVLKLHVSVVHNGELHVAHFVETGEGTYRGMGVLSMDADQWPLYLGTLCVGAGTDDCISEIRVEDPRLSPEDAERLAGVIALEDQRRG